MNMPQHIFNDEAAEVFCALSNHQNKVRVELQECVARKQPVDLECGVAELNDKIRLAHYALRDEYNSSRPRRLVVSKGFASASCAFEGISDYMSAMQKDVDSGLAGEKDDDARRISENCFIVLRACVRFLGNGLNEILPDQPRLCLDWRFAFLELAVHLHLYAESCGMSAWSCDMEKGEARKQLAKDFKLCKNMASEVAKVLFDREWTEETIGRFLVFRNMRTKDIREIWEQTDTGAYENIYEGFEPRATKILDKLFKAYASARSGGGENDAGAADGWCCVEEQWRQAFQKRKNGDGADRFFNENIDSELRKPGGPEGEKLKDVPYWRIKPTARKSGSRKHR